MNRLRATALALLVASAASGASAQQLSYVQPLSSAGTAAVQQKLKDAGVYAGRTDGVWGRDSSTALERYQRRQGLQITGQLNPATATTLGVSPADLLPPPGAAAAAPATAAEPLAPDVVRTIQTRLRGLGFYPGGIDGIWGPSMQTALQRFQQGRGLQATGQLNPATITALGLDPNNLAAPVR